MTTPDSSVTTPPARKDLPYGEEAGTLATWTLHTGKTSSIVITGTFIGLGSSEQPDHRGHPADEYAPQKQHCNACRWFETRIFRIETQTDDAARPTRVSYLLHHVGVSEVPSEVDFFRHDIVHSAHEVIEVFTVRKNTPDGRAQAPFLTRPAARALSQAAGYDAELEAAYIDRAIA